MEKYKYLFLITDSYPFGNGETFIENEIEFLSKNFEKVFIISKNMKDKQTRKIPDNCEVFKIKKDYKKLINVFFDKNYLIDFAKNFNLKNLRKLLGFQFYSKMLEKKVSEVINSNNLKKEEILFYSYWFREGAYAGINLKRKNVIEKVISRAHRYDLYLEENYQPLKKEILNIVDNVYPCSKEGELYLKEKYKYSNYKEKIKYGYLGTINKNIFKLKDKNSTINLISCSNTIPLKRVDLIVEGLSNLSEKVTKKYTISWIHIGDGVEQENIKKLSENKLKNISFKFVGGISNKEVLDFYKENDIYLFLHMSSSEGLPVSMMEVQSFGIPMIATDVGGVSEIVNEKTGILLSANPEIKEITEAIEKMINLSNKESQEYQKNSYNNWKENFNAEKNYLKFIKEIKNNYK